MPRAGSHDSSSRVGAINALAMLVSGTFSTVIMKTEYGIRSVGSAECTDPATGLATKLCPFDKPWFGVLQMKVAMALCLLFLYARKCFMHRRYLETPVLRLRKGGRRYVAAPPDRMREIKQKYGAVPPESEVDAIKRKYQHHERPDESSSLLQDASPMASLRLPGSDDAQQGRVSFRTLVSIAVPSLLDLLQTVFANVGLLWISSSVYQMARGSVIIFSAFFSVRLMGKRLFAYHYASIALVTLAVVLVGYAGVAHSNAASDGSASPDATINGVLGLAFIIVAQVLCALQIVVEEHMMLALNVSPMLLVGFEGLWGLAFYVLLVPVLTLTPPGSTPFSRIWHEDFYDSFVQLGNSWTLVAFVVAYIVAVGTLNVTGNYVTKHLSAVMRSITEVRSSVLCLVCVAVLLLTAVVVLWSSTDAPHARRVDAQPLRLLRARVADCRLARRALDGLQLVRALSLLDGRPKAGGSADLGMVDRLELAGFVLMVYGTLSVSGRNSSPLDTLT